MRSASIRPGARREGLRNMEATSRFCNTRAMFPAWRTLAISAALYGCGRVGFEISPSADDGRVAGDGVLGDGVLGDGVLGDGATISGRHWTQRSASTPGRLLAPRLAYVPGHGVVMYGGSRSSTVPPTMAVAAMWELAPTGWQSICDPCPPVPDRKEVFIKRGNNYHPAIAAIGKKTKAAPEHTCRAAVQVSKR
jgi:hypothetical protein